MAFNISSVWSFYYPLPGQLFLHPDNHSQGIAHKPQLCDIRHQNGGSLVEYKNN